MFLEMNIDITIIKLIIEIGELFNKVGLDTTFTEIELGFIGFVVVLLKLMKIC